MTATLSGQQVLVTGGSGFIGSFLTERLVADGARVTVVDDLRTSTLANLTACLDRIDYVKEDILGDGFAALLTARPFDVIFHLAGNPYVPPSVEQPWSDFELNLVGTLRLLETVRRVERRPRIVLASSAAVYGDLDATPITEEHPTVPISPYGVSKLAAERYGAVYASLYGLRIASLRFFSVYGPRQRKQVVYDLMRKFDGGAAEVEVLGDGSQVRDFNYVADIVAAARAVAESGPLRGEAYNVAGGHSCSIGDLVAVLARLLDSRARVRWSGAVRPGDPQRWLADHTRVTALGWRPSVGLAEGLQKTVAWYRAEAGRCES